MVSGGTLGGNGTIMSIDNNNILAYQTLSAPTILTSGGADFGQGYQTGTSFRCKLTAYFEKRVIISGYFSLYNDISAKYRY